MMASDKKTKYLLLQVRNADDPMRAQEVVSFVEAIGCHPDQIQPWDLLAGPPPGARIKAADIVLVGGSGHYSAAGELTDWLRRALDVFVELYDSQTPTFASCWGIQAMARALGGTTIKDLERAELGSLEATLTAAGRADPIFAPLGDSFLTLQGHEDRVSVLPPGAVLLASTPRNPIQAFTFPQRPIYATQFHPELSLRRYMQRLHTYPEYVERILGIGFQDFVDRCEEPTETIGIIRRFVANFS